MGFLPNKAVVLNNDLTLRKELPRLGPQGEIGGVRLREGHYDDLIVEHKETFADALRSAGLIEHDSGLLYLGRPLNIDVLFAEVDESTATFRRFIIGEDKLCRNPEARREVLGQILDYSRALRELDPDELGERVDAVHGAWIEAHEDLIRPALRDANFLLVVCGDAIHSRVINYVNHLKDVIDPLIQADLALMSMAVFSDGTDHILIPHVVGAMVRAERAITIKVVVSDARDVHIPSAVTIVTAPSPAGGPGRITLERDALLAEIGRVGAKDREAAEWLFETAEELGADVSFKSASASIRVQNETTGRPCTICVVTQRGTFYTGFVGRWERNAGVGPEVAAEYEAALAAVLGRSPRMASGDLGGQRAIRLEVVGEHRHEVLTAIAKVVAILRQSRPVTSIGND